MNLTFELLIVQDGLLRIKDTTRENNLNEYLDEEAEQYVRLGRFKYSDTATINVIKYKTYRSSTPTIVDVIISKHVDENGDLAQLDEAYYALSNDGHYIIDHIVLPTETLAKHLINLESNKPHGTVGINDYSNFYTTDGKKIFKYINGIPEECTIEELIEVNVEASNLSKISQETFSIYFLHQCYLEQSKIELNNLICKSCKEPVSDALYNINLIWVSINAIKYNVEFGLLDQAQSVLEDLNRCGSICKPVKHNLYDCNCCK